ncbi:hypothetical protein L208DRAFT_1381166 [Tricholoma matsutake]|nr:hypothetical protein L208DRAFT_1381166 [Tricholoma matsutake 945]
MNANTVDIEEPAHQCLLLLLLQWHLSQAENELCGHLKDVQIACQLLQVDEADDSEPSYLNSTLIGRALKHLVVYHVYNILPFPSSVNTMPIVISSAIAQPSLENLALHSVKTWSSAMSNPASIPLGSSRAVGELNVTALLMKSVMGLKMQTQGEKILCNIQTMCMEIAALMQGCWDLTEDHALMQSMSSHKDVRPTKIMPAQLSIPLQLATGILPLSLILQKLLWGQQGSQSSVIMAFPAYSSSKPASLEAVEMVLWKAIVAIIHAEKEPVLAILEALTTMQSMASVVLEEDGAWFTGDGLLAAAQLMTTNPSWPSIPVPLAEPDHIPGCHPNPVEPMIDNPTEESSSVSNKIRERDSTNDGAPEPSSLILWLICSSLPPYKIMEENLCEDNLLSLLTWDLRAPNLSLLFHRLT